jgi:hypothetical protein
MINTFLKTFCKDSIKITAALIFLSGLSPDLAEACGGGDECDYSICQSVFLPEIIESPEEAPFFLSSHSFYEGESSRRDIAPRDSENRNLTEWSSYFANKVDTATLSTLVYKLPLKELDNLIFSLKGQEKPKSPEMATLQKSLETAGPIEKTLRALYYLGFAKRCEPVATQDDSQDRWQPSESGTTGGQDALTTVAENQIASSAKVLANLNDDFLKRRYEFQVLRMYFYSHDLNGAIDYYKSHPELLSDNDSIKFRSMEIFAGSLFKTQDYGNANYAYSLIFAQYPPLKKNAILAFHPQEEKDWQQTLSMAKNSQEKTILWQMFGITSDELLAIQKIYELEPASRLLPLLMTREVNKSESLYFADNKKATPDFRPTAKIFKALAKDPRVYKPWLWKLATAHLQVLAGNLSEAQTQLNELSNLKPSSNLFREQLRMTRFFWQVQSYKTPHQKTANTFVPELQWLALQKQNDRAQNLLHWAWAHLSQVYEASNDVVRSLLLVDKPQSSFYRDNKTLELLLAFLSRQPKSVFDSYLMVHHDYTLTDLKELKALNFLYAGELKQAATVMPAVLKSGPLLADPFLIHIKDCHDCDHEAPKKTDFTKSTFLKALASRLELANGTGTTAAEANLDIGNALYNISYYGNARDMYATPHENYSQDWDNGSNMQPARSYYERALQLSTDREFKAKVTFLLSKTDLNDAITAENKLHPYTSFELIPAPPKQFETLRSQFSDTQYYKEIIQECGYFRAYVQKK